MKKSSSHIHTVSEALALADRAAAAFPAWSRTGPSHRRELLLRTAELLASQSETFVELMVEETGMSSHWAEFNVRASLTGIREAASLTTQVMGETIPSDHPGCLTLTERIPAGVVLGIAPWNAPLVLGLRAVLMPLACGNTAILKASELCPRTHLMIGRLLRDAGFPEGSIEVVSNASSDAAVVVESLIAHPAVRRVNFTGSTHIGKIIGGLAGRYLKPALLELGGKAPLIVLRDADLAQAVNAAAFGAFMHQGQICMSTERIIVEGPIADAFVAALADKVHGLLAQPNGGVSPLFASVINSAAADRLEALLEDARSQGAHMVVPMRRDGLRVSPAVVDGLKSTMRLYVEESFGPIAPVIRVADAAQAVRVANDTEYGLAGAVFGSDVARTVAVARQLECGACHVNGATVKSESHFPFGGVKSSGYGRFGGRASIQEFTELRTLTISTQPATYPF